MTDLLALTADLVDIPSVSFEEAELVALLEAELRAVPGLTVDRIGDNLVAGPTLDVSTVWSSAGTPTPSPGTHRVPVWRATPCGALGRPI